MLLNENENVSHDFHSFGWLCAYSLAKLPLFIYNVWFVFFFCVLKERQIEFETRIDVVVKLNAWIDTQSETNWK